MSESALPDFVLSAYIFSGSALLSFVLLAAGTDHPFTAFRWWLVGALLLGTVSIAQATVWGGHFSYYVEGLITVSLIALWFLLNKRRERARISAPLNFKVLGVLFLCLYAVVLLGPGELILGVYTPGELLAQVYEDAIFWVLLSHGVKSAHPFKHVLAMSWIMALAHLHEEFWPAISLVFVSYLPIWGLFSLGKIGFPLGVLLHFTYNSLIFNYPEALSVEMILTLMLVGWLFILSTPEKRATGARIDDPPSPEVNVNEAFRQ